MTGCDVSEPEAASARRAEGARVTWRRGASKVHRCARRVHRHRPPPAASPTRGGAWRAAAAAAALPPGRPGKATAHSFLIQSLFSLWHRSAGERWGGTCGLVREVWRSRGRRQDPEVGSPHPTARRTPGSGPGGGRAARVRSADCALCGHQEYGAEAVDTRAENGGPLAGRALRRRPSATRAAL